MADRGAIGFGSEKPVRAGQRYASGDLTSTLSYDVLDAQLESIDMSSLYSSLTMSLVSSQPQKANLNIPSAAAHKIAGVVLNNAVPVAGSTVKVIRRDTNTVLASTVSAVDGSFSISLIGFSGACTVYAQDATGTYNAVVFDLVIPA